MPFDPTGTTKQRIAFRREARSRLQKLYTLTRIAVIEHDMLGMRPAQSVTAQYRQPLSHGMKLSMFADWFKNTAHTLLIGDGQWYRNHMRFAYESGKVAAEKYTKTKPQTDPNDTYTIQARHDLEGIINEMVKRVVRVTAVALRSETRPRLVYNAISQAARKMASPRLDAFANVAVVQLHNHARVNEFKSVGISKVGVIPERLPKPVMHDARRGRRRAAEDLVNILTAGDDDVCEECEDYADDGPYNIDEVDLPLHPNCLPGNCLISSSSKITAISKRLYHGDLVIVHTASGRKLSCTPNHPILTDHGFVPARALKIGGNVISDSASKWSLGANAQDNDMPSRIEDIAAAFFKRSSVTCLKVPVSAPDFHGDVAEGHVAIIGTDSLLRRHNQPALSQHISELLFGARGVCYNLLARLRTFFFDFHAVMLPLSCGVSHGHLVSAFTDTHVGPFYKLLLRLGPQFGTTGFKNSINNTSVKTVFIRERLNTISGLVISEDCFLDSIVNIGSSVHSGSVYNIQTEASYYIAQGIATHNCRCAVVPADDLRFAEPEDRASVAS